MEDVSARQPCRTCPFDFSDAVEDAINLGCVPDIFEIMQIKRASGHNWGCHSADDDEERICAGFVRECVERGIEYRGSPILTYKDWFEKGVPDREEIEHG